MVNGIGRLFDYARTVHLENKWQQRKYELSEPKSESEGYSYISTFLKKNKEAQKTTTLQFITSKLKSGQRLSYSEMEFLRVNDPALYAKAVKIEKEREEYRRALKNCKTKEEAQRLHAGKTLELQTEAKPAPGASHGKEKEDERIEFIAMRMMAIFNEFAEFLDSKEYKDMPSENDKDEDKEDKEGKEKGKKVYFDKASFLYILSKNNGRRIFAYNTLQQRHSEGS